MRYHLFSVIILILLFLPNLSYASQPLHVESSPYLSQSSNSHAYNFTSYQIGQAPTNKSWITFSTVNGSSSFSSGVMETAFGKGLNVYSSSYYNPSYLVLNISTKENATLTLNLTWNEASSTSMTDNRIDLFNGSAELFNTSFGVSPQHDTSISNRSGTKYIGPEPPHSTEISVSFTILHTGGIGYVSYRNKSLTRSPVPVKIGYENNPGGYTDVRIGGYYSNLTIYNISESAPRNLDTAKKTATLPNMNSSAFTLGTGYMVNVSQNYHPFIDVGLNSVIYYSNSGLIESYDYYTNKVSNLSGMLDNIQGGLSNGSDLFYWNVGKTVTIYRINLETLNVSEKTTGITLNGEVYGVLSTSQLTLYNESGFIVQYNTINGSATAISSIGQMFGISTPEVSSLKESRGMFIVTGFSNSERCFFNLSLSENGLIPSREATQNYTFLNSKVSQVSSSYGNRGMESLLVLSYTLSQRILYRANSTPFMTGGNYPLHSLEYNTGNLTVATLNGSLAVANNTTLQVSDQIKLNSTSSLVYTDQNLSEIAIFTTSDINIFYAGPSLPLSNSFIKLTGNQSYVLTGASCINLTVESRLGYSVSLSFGHFSPERYNSSDFRINSTDFQNGVYRAYANATNEAGYRSDIMFNVVVDNAVPSWSVSPGNGSLISNVTSVTFSVNDTMGISSTSISYLSRTLVFNRSNGTFVLESGKITGSVIVNFTVTDGYNLTFRQSYSYIVIGFNNTSGINLWNGEYLNSTNVDVSWSAQANATSYEILAMNVSTERHADTVANSTILELSNGAWRIYLNETLLDNQTITISTVNITIISYSPAIELSNIPTGAYSITGNSLKDNFTTSIISNITSKITVRLISPGNITETTTSAEDGLSFSTAEYSGLFSLSGNYEIVAHATSLSGTSAWRNFTLAVNNSIPGSPAFRSDTVYSNGSLINTGLKRISGLNYSYSLYYGGHIAKIISSPLKELNLSMGQGVYSLNVTDYSDSGNHNSSTLKIYFFSKKPVIHYNVDRNLTTRNFTNLRINVSDPSPIGNIDVDVNGTLHHLNGTSVSLLLTFVRNGDYNVSVNVTDLCGNRNRTENVTVNVSYYIHLVSPVITASHKGNRWTFRIESGGNGLSRVNTTWFLNGKEVARGTEINITLPYGVHTVSANLIYQGKSVKLERRVVYFGLIPYVSVPALAFALIAIRRLRSNTNESDIRELIIRNTGRSMKSLRGEARRKRIRTGPLKTALSKLEKEGVVSSGIDPDGRKYVMPGKGR